MYIHIYIHTQREYILEYYSAFNKKETLPFATTGMNLDDIMLNDRQSIQRPILDDLIYFWTLKQSN